MKSFSPAVALSLTALILSTLYSSAQTFPANFSQVQVASGISNPTVMAFAPDGRIFVAQQNGVLHVIKNGSKLATPALQLSVNSSGERGLIGIALHPSFALNGFVYLYHTLPDGSRNRVSRFTMSGDVINPSTQVSILTLDALSSATNHNGGAMQFKGDKLYIAIGENATPANAQSLETYHGKLLRVNADGTAPTDNPFYTSTASEQRKRIWVYGLRNPYTFDVQPGTLRVFVNDVGQSTWEEIDDATPGRRNFGWPDTEGTTTDPSYVSPVFAYPHGSGDGSGCAITGGVFFNPTSTNYPSTYAGKYFYQDLCNAWINYIDLSSGAVRHAFATGLPGQSLALDMGTDGNLYYLSRNAGALYKIVYTNSQPPVITDQPDNATRAVGQSVTFSVSATGALPLSYQWKKSGVNITGATSSSYTIANVQTSHAGSYSVTVTNSFGSVNSNAAVLTVSTNALPSPSIITPAAGAMYRGGDVINFSGNGTDPEDGTLPASAFSWTVVFQHADHVHDGPPIAQGVKSGSFTIPNTGETASNVFYRLNLTVQDSQGQTATTFVDVRPYTSNITLKTTPAGLNLTLDGQPVVTRYSTTGVEGIVRSIGVVTPQTLNSVSYAFASWAQGGSATQSITTPIDNVTYTANFSKALTSPWRTTDIGKVNVIGNATISNGTFTLTGSGSDIYGTSDNFRLVYQQVSGNTEIRARVTGITNTHAWAKAGVMIRESLQPNSKHAMVMVTPSSGTSFQRRTSIGGTTAGNNSTGASPYWVRLVRSGSIFTAYVSSNGSSWTAMGSPVTISMATSVYVGLAYTSHSNNVSGTATMTNVSVTVPTTAAGQLEEELALHDDNPELSVYPNPLDDDLLFLKLKIKQNSNCQVEILNNLGQVILHRELAAADNADAIHELNLEGISQGLYFVRVQAKGRNFVKSFVRR